MSSKQLSSILKSAPAATVSGQQRLVDEERGQDFTGNPIRVEQQARIVAVIPLSLKEEIKLYTKANKGMTERMVLLKALKQMGFNIKEHWLVDNRSTR
jgi:hypothetical protein